MVFVLMIGISDRTCGDIVFENARVRAVLGEDAVWRSLVDKATGAEHIGKPATTFASATHPKTDARDHVDVLGLQQRVTSSRADTVTASRARMAENRLIITVGESELTYRFATQDDWIAFTLEKVSGRRPQALDLLRLSIDTGEHVGSRLAVACDEKFAVGLAALNFQSHATASRSGGRTVLAAQTQDAPGPPIEGAGAAIVAAPTTEFPRALQRLSKAFDLPRNEAGDRPSKELPMARESYWFLSFGEADIDRVISLCQQSGIRRVLLSSGAWCRSPGHYDFNTKNFPEGLESLRRSVARLNAAGVGVGMHCFASKVAKIDAYVTPVPDRRFWVDRSDALSADVGPSDAEIRVTGDLRQWPGSPVASQILWEGGVDRHREVIIDDEIIRYERIGPADRWNTFEGCRRGAWGTRPAAHEGGAIARHYGVDGCINGYIVDQETSLINETTSRLASIFNACAFDMVYFDGGEDVDRRRFVHYVSRFQAAAMARFTKRPIVHMGTILTHNLWHSFTRSGTVDTYLNTLRGKIIAGAQMDSWPTVRERIDKSVAYLESLRNDMMPSELGWFGIWPKEKGTDGLQIDDIEYLMCRSLAYDAPISLQTSFSQMAKHPLTAGILELVRAYEQLRKERTFSEQALAPLRQKGADHAVVRIDDGWRLFRFGPRFAIGDGAFAQTGEGGQSAIALLWHPVSEGHLRIPIPRAKVRLQDLTGHDVPIDEIEGHARLPLGPRRYALFADRMTSSDLRNALAKSEFIARQR